MHNKVSTNHYPFKDFKPHGLVEFYQREHTLLTTATGPFNEEIIEAILSCNKIISTNSPQLMVNGMNWLNLKTRMATPRALEN